MDKSNKLLPIGISDFKKIRVEHYYFVDKSLLIRDLLNAGAEVTLITRPRRFGKTLNMSMLKAFFEISNENTADYFEGLEIFNIPDYDYRKEQGKYPVVFLTLKDIKCNSWEETLEMLEGIIQDEYNRYAPYLLESSHITDFDKAYIKRLLSHRASPVDLQNSLKRLTYYLFKHYGTAPILLLDEYDTPIQQGYLMGFYDSIIGFFRNWLSGGLKDNEYLKFSVLTGILHIAQESIFSGLNNPDVCTVLDAPYQQYFGFTQEEIDDISKYYKCMDKTSELQEWYDGYSFGGLDIYNPWSIVKYIRSGCIPAPYWLSTSSNDLIHQMIEISTDEVKGILKDLLDGKMYTAQLEPQIIYPKIYDSSNNLFSFLVMTGYLKAVRQNYGKGYYDFALQIPNKEIANVYKEEILSLAETKVGGNTRYTMELRRALFEGDARQLDVLLRKIIEFSVSYYDVRESFYHGWMLALTGMFYDTHYIQSNRESGVGRYDIMMLPKTSQFPGIILEFKVLTEAETKKGDTKERLKRLANKALLQIKEQNYAAELQKQDVKTIIKYGIAFYKKDLFIVKE